MSVLAATSWLADAMLEHPRLAIGRAQIWLLTDVMASNGENEAVEYPVQCGMYAYFQICTPEERMAIMRAFWSGADEWQLYARLLEGLNAYLVEPLTELEEVNWGPPVHSLAYGDDVFGMMEAMVAGQEIINMTGIELPNAPGSEEKNTGLRVIRRLVESLDTEDRESAHFEVGSALSWLYSISGNSVIDFDEEALQEIRGFSSQYMDWSKETIAYLNEMNLEAREIFDAAQIGMELLLTDEAWREALLTNLRMARKGKKHELRWPDTTQGHS